MSKNTSSSAFRKIDVDEYNEDNYKEEEGGEVCLGSPVGPDEAEVNALLSSGRNFEALKTVLRLAPLSSKNQQVKDAALELTLRVLMSIKSSEMEEGIKGLVPDEVDTLMKYIYRGFETPTERSSAHLLAWHEKAFNVGGTGSITRVLTDRKRV